MLEIDIVGQLIPNVTTMLVQLCSTTILFLLAYKYLWPSVRKFLDAQQEQIQKDLLASQQLKQEADQDRQKAHEQLNLAAQQSQQMIEAAVVEAKQQKEDILKQANHQANLAKEKALEQVEAQKRQMQSQIQNDMIEIAMLATKQMVAASDVDKINQEALETFVKETYNA